MMVAGNAPGYQKEIDNFTQSNTSNLFQVFLQTYDKVDITLTSNISIDSNVINVSSGHGINSGMILIIYNDNYFWQVEVKNVNINTITLYSKSYLTFNISGTKIIRGTSELNNASIGVTYKFGIPGNNIQPIDITSALFIMNTSSQGDDGNFGDLSQLTNGLFVRKEGILKFNFGTFRANRDFRLRNASIDYSDKGPGGTYGVNIKFKLQGQENFDQVVRIFYGDHITVLRQDALNGLNYFRISLIGSYTEGE